MFDSDVKAVPKNLGNYFEQIENVGRIFELEQQDTDNEL